MGPVPGCRPLPTPSHLCRCTTLWCCAAQARWGWQRVVLRGAGQVAASTAQRGLQPAAPVPQSDGHRHTGAQCILLDAFASITSSSPWRTQTLATPRPHLQVYHYPSLRAWLCTGQRMCPKTNLKLVDLEVRHLVIDWFICWASLRARTPQKGRWRQQVVVQATCALGGAGLVATGGLRRAGQAGSCSQHALPCCHPHAGCR